MGPQEAGLYAEHGRAARVFDPPRARVIAYKGLGDLGGFTSDLAAAIVDRILERNDAARLGDPRVRQAVRQALGMHTDLAPGKLFLAQKGSGQAMKVLPKIQIFEIPILFPTC